MFQAFPLSWINNSIFSLPTHIRLNYFWNFGSFLGIILVLQVITGLVLSINYIARRQLAFERINLICQETFNGAVVRWVHLNGASLFFLLIYLHVGRGMLNLSFRLIKPWLSGVTIMLLLIAAAFLGYVLPWGQISLWGATVITNLITAIPILGKKVIFWVWGGFSVTSATLRFFYTLHFLIPFIILALMLLHLIFLHETGSSRRIFLHTNETKIKFNYNYVIKDMVRVSPLFLFMFFIFVSPYKLGDPENFIFANPLMSPLHIQPEWYFLFAYAILRSIPNKLGGVVALVFSVIVFYLFPFFSATTVVLKPLFKNIFWLFISVFILLTWLGGNPVEDPYIFVGQLLSFLYFLLISAYFLPFFLLFRYYKSFKKFQRPPL